MTRIVAAFSLYVLSCLFAAAVHAAGGGLTLNLSSPPFYTGTRTQVGASFDKTVPGDGVVYHAPFTLHVHVPAGAKLVGVNVAGGVWSCPSFGSGVQDIACTYSQDLDGWNWSGSSISLNVDVSTGMTLGNTAVRFSVESAELPLAAPPSCVATTSMHAVASQCADVAVAVMASLLEITDWSTNAPGRVATWNGPPFEAGATASVEVDLRNTGYGPGNGPTTLRLWLPTGLRFDHAVTGTPTFACSAADQASGQVVTCTTAYMVNGQLGDEVLSLSVGYDVPVPGPLIIYGAVGNATQPLPSDCATNVNQTGCGRLTVGTRVPRTPYLRFAARPGDVTHSPHVFELGSEHGPIVVNFENDGEGNAAATTLAVKLPPGFSYSRTFNAIPALSCSSSGAVVDGPVLICVGAGLPGGGDGFLSFGVNVGVGAPAPGPVVLVGAIDASSPASAATLSSCTSDPNPAYCFWHDIPTFAPCALQYGTDGVYCDGFETVVPQ